MKSTHNSLLYIAVIVSIVISSCSKGDIDTFEKEPDFLPSGCVMKFERKGGYFGWHDAFWIYPDGRVFNSVGKTARIPSYSVTEWMEIISPVADPILKKTPSFRSVGSVGSVGMDCYKYLITVYDKGGTRLLSLHCTDTYPLNKDDNIPVIDIGRIRDTLLSLSWE